jgi:hypothetical protein
MQGFKFFSIPRRNYRIIRIDNGKQVGNYLPADKRHIAAGYEKVLT